MQIFLAVGSSVLLLITALTLVGAQETKPDGATNARPQRAPVEISPAVIPIIEGKLGGYAPSNQYIKIYSNADPELRLEQIDSSEEEFIDRLAILSRFRSALQEDFEKNRLAALEEMNFPSTETSYTTETNYQGQSSKHGYYLKPLHIPHVKHAPSKF